MTADGAEEDEFPKEDGNFAEDDGELHEEAMDEAGLGTMADDASTIEKARSWKWDQCSSAS